MRFLYKIVFGVAFITIAVLSPATGFIILGLFLIIVLAYVIAVHQRIKKHGFETKGFITACESDKEGYKTPIIEFKTSPGETISGKPFISFSFDGIGLFKKSEIGKEVIVKYDELKPAKFMLQGQKKRTLMVYILIGLVGLIFIAVGCLALTGKINLLNT